MTGDESLNSTIVNSDGCFERVKQRG